MFVYQRSSRRLLPCNVLSPIPPQHLSVVRLCCTVLRPARYQKNAEEGKGGKGRKSVARRTQRHQNSMSRRQECLAAGTARCAEVSRVGKHNVMVLIMHRRGWKQKSWQERDVQQGVVFVPQFPRLAPQQQAGRLDRSTLPGCRVCARHALFPSARREMPVALALFFFHARARPPAASATAMAER